MKDVKKENKNKKTVSEPDLLNYDLNEFSYDGNQDSDEIIEEEEIEVDYDADDVEVDF